MADAERCCKGTCRRGNQPPPMLMRSELTGTWYVVLRYKDLGNDNYEAIEKHPLAARSVEQLDEMRTALLKARAGDEHYPG